MYMYSGLAVHMFMYKFSLTIIVNIHYGKRVNTILNPFLFQCFRNFVFIFSSLLECVQLVFSCQLILETTKFCYPEELLMDKMGCERSELLGFKSKNVLL